MSKYFALNSDDATERYLKYQDIDPYPEIDPALLNSADIIDYIEAIGMVYPFDLKNETVKGATISLRIGEIGVYWDEEKKKIVKDIKTDKEFILKSNSIAYVSILEELRLPAYIIARFNLRVTNAYKGILLGTGPIVDPGFQGQLYIPLHNLTNNDYVLYPGDHLIEMEFTKLSTNKLWNKESTRESEYLKWESSSGEKDPKKRDIHYYLRRANDGRSIESSLPSLKKDIKESIDKAAKASEKVETNLNRINVGLLFSFAALLTAIVGIVNVFRGDIKEIKEKKFEQRIETLERKYDSIIKLTPQK